MSDVFSIVTTGGTDDALEPHLEARRVVAAPCRGLARDVVEIAQLLTSELVKHASHHGAGSIGIEVTLSESALRIVVHDDGGGQSHRAAVDPRSIYGRGLMLVESLAARWGVTPQADGKRIWFELRTA